MASEGMNRPRSSQRLTSMCCATGNEIFLSSISQNALSVDDQRVATVHDHHVFVEIMHMLSGGRIWAARPERHLAAILPIEKITFNTGRGLIGTRNIQIGQDVNQKNKDRGSHS